eukprot:3798113-Rhodomonas_salina.2
MPPFLPSAAHASRLERTSSTDPGGRSGTNSMKQRRKHSSIPPISWAAKPNRCWASRKEYWCHFVTCRCWNFFARA